MSDDRPGIWYSGEDETGPTQLVPEGGWPAQPPSRSAGPGQPGPGQPRGGRPRSGRAGFRQRWLRPKRLMAMAGLLVLALVLAGGGLYLTLNSKLTRVSVLSASSAASEGTNWLITGSDSRSGLTGAQKNALALGHNITGARSDTILILHLPANGGRAVLVSIPRDSYVPIPGHGWNKINAAYAYGGPKLLIETIQNVSGLRIDHYLGIGFSGLVSVVNDVGGVRMCLKSAMKDPKAGLNLTAGCHDLTGKQALALVRTRRFALGDLQREQDQRVFLKALLSKMTSPGTLANPFRLVPAASGAASAVTVDSGTSLYQLKSVAFGLRNPVTTTVPYSGFANEANAGSVVIWNKSAASELFADLAADRALPASLITGSSMKGTA